MMYIQKTEEAVKRFLKFGTVVLMLMETSLLLTLAVYFMMNPAQWPMLLPAMGALVLGLVACYGLYLGVRDAGAWG